MLAYILGITKLGGRAIKELQIRARFRVYKSGQKRLQIGTA